MELSKKLKLYTNPKTKNWTQREKSENKNAHKTYNNNNKKQEN